MRPIPSGGVPSDAFTDVKEVEGQMLTVGRAPGDLITKSVVGESSASGVPSQLEPGHVALAVRVDMASGVAGLIREGQTVTLFGMLAPDVVQSALSANLSAGPQIYDTGSTSNPNAPTATPTPTPTPAPMQSPIVRIAITGIKVLLVPQSFRYQELPPGSGNDQMFASATTSQSAQSGSVVVLDVPLQPVELKPGLRVNPATLLAALNEYGKLHLAIEPAGGLQVGDILTLNLGEMYQALNKETTVSEPVAARPTAVPASTATVTP